MISRVTQSRKGFAMNDPEIVLRPLRTNEEYRACVELQKQTWGEHFTHCVPSSILMVNQKIGGVTSGAFDQDGNLLGFVFGMTGMKDGRLVHWSDMLAVRKEIRGCGLGRRLKLFQRELLLEVGVEVVYWTYDPLVARNAHLNINRLGAEIDEYVPDMYGDDAGNELQRGIGTDRFVVAWHIADKRVDRVISGQVRNETPRFAQAPVVNTRLGEDGFPTPFGGDLPAHTMVRVEIPSDILAVQNESLGLAAQWRANTNRVFIHYFDRDYRVKIFYREPESNRCFYGLLRERENDA
jgi:chorismate synthase